MPVDALLSLAHTMVTAKGTQALLLGSGVSRSAQVPTGWDVTLDLVRHVAVLDGAQPGENLATWYQETYGEAPDYSALIGSLAKTPAERRALLQNYFEPTTKERETGIKTPTAAHRAIARLVAGGFVRIILTTNFDRLLESALRDEGVEPVVVSNADATKGAAPITHQRCLVVKLHGDYLDDRIKNTDAELASYDPRMDIYLDRILDEFGLIVCGWSGDWDAALRSAMERCKSRRYSTTWVAVGEPSARAERLIALRGAQVVTTTGADAFFGSLAEKVESLADLGTVSPLSVGTAIASLKRYIAEDRHRVRLEDLIMEEAARLAGQLASDFPLQGGPSPTPELEAARVLRMDAATEILRSLFFHGCRLTTGDQEQIFLRALGLLAPPEDDAGWDTWRAMTRYPMASVLYAGAFGALAVGNYRLLRRLLIFSYRVNGRERIACDRLTATRVLPKEVADALFLPEYKHNPASVHLADVLRGLASGLHSDPDLLFDELEVWVALAHLDVVRDLNSPPYWMPPGRFGWRGRWQEHYQPSILLTEAIAAGARWPPISAGWFGGRLDRWIEVREAFAEVYQRTAASME